MENVASLLVALFLGVDGFLMASSGKSLPQRISGESFGHPGVRWSWSALYLILAALLLYHIWR